MRKGNFDIVYVCHKKDANSLEQSIKYIKKNVSNYRKIFLVAKDNFLFRNKDIYFIDEKNFPFQKKDIKKYTSNKRVGWYFQQFLKLYFLRVVGKKALDNILIIDADTIFIRKTKFFENGIPLYNIEKGYHQPYYNILEKVFGFGRQNSRFSGITHHMVFQRKYINEIIEFVFKKNGKEFWKEIMENVNKETESGFSEYDLYFYYMLKNYPNNIKIRKLRFINFPYYSYEWIKIFRFFGYYYLSAHEYLRRSRFPIAKSLVLEVLKLISLRVPLKETLIKLKFIKIK